jgi:hypothetical protein
VPLFPAMRDLLERVREAKQPAATDRVIPIDGARTVVGNSCKRAGLPHFLHHSLRHYFCSNAIEASVDFKVSAGWLGHCDGGFLVAKTYGHLRDAHSVETAKRMVFSAGGLPAPKLDPTADADHGRRLKPRRGRQPRARLHCRPADARRAVRPSTLHSPSPVLPKSAGPFFRLRGGRQTGQAVTRGHEPTARLSDRGGNPCFGCGRPGRRGRASFGSGVRGARRGSSTSGISSGEQILATMRFLRGSGNSPTLARQRTPPRSITSPLRDHEPPKRSQAATILSHHGRRTRRS